MFFFLHTVSRETETRRGLQQIDPQKGKHGGVRFTKFSDRGVLVPRIVFSQYYVFLLSTVFTILTVAEEDWVDTTDVPGPTDGPRIHRGVYGLSAFPKWIAN